MDIPLQALTTEAFAPFGQVIEVTGDPTAIINQGLCQRFSDLVDIDVSHGGGRAGLSLFKSKLRTLPYELVMVERHPLGSQAFLPLSDDPFLVIVAPDEDGAPGKPLAFLTEPFQGINFTKGTWHGVLTPLAGPGLFAVIDRIGGQGSNLDEIWFHKPYRVTL